MHIKGYFERINEAMEKYGDKVIAKDSLCELKYSDLLIGADSFCAELLKMGLNKGDRVALCGYNSCLWLKAYFGIIKAGGVAVLINYALSKAEMGELIKDIDARFLVWGNCKPTEKGEDLTCGLVESGCALDMNGFNSTTEVTAPSPISPIERRADFVVFTSGSTGKPKGALHSQLSNLAGCDALCKIIPEIEGESICLALPMFHIYGLALTISHIMHGGTLLLSEKFSNDDINSCIKNDKADSIAAVMTVLCRLASDSQFDESLARSVKRIYTGGAPLMPVQMLRLEQAFSNAVVLNCYGQTESDSGIAMTVFSDSFEKRSATVGKPLPYRTVAILNSDGSICKTDEVGEITVKDDGNITLGYYGLPEEKQPIDKNGWLHTGDLGFIDVDGYLHISGRIKDIIIKGGENIIPADIEKEIAQIDGVGDVKVFGAPNELYGESVEACVAKSGKEDISEEQIKKALKGKISNFKMPSHIFFYDGFPLKSNGKLDACALKINMLRDLNRRIIDENIQKGIRIFYFSSKSQRYIILPVCSSVEAIISNYGFTPERARQISLCVEEMLLERVNNAYMDIGELSLSFELWPDFVRISFSDEGNFLDFGKAAKDPQSSYSVKIISRYVDRLTTEKLENNLNVYHFDFIYNKEFDTKEFFDK